MTIALTVAALAAFVAWLAYRAAMRRLIHEWHRDLIAVGEAKRPESKAAAIGLLRADEDLLWVLCGTAKRRAAFCAAANHLRILGGVPLRHDWPTLNENTADANTTGA